MRRFAYCTIAFTLSAAVRAAPAPSATPTATHSAETPPPPPTAPAPAPTAPAPSPRPGTQPTPAPAPTPVPAPSESMPNEGTAAPPGEALPAESESPPEAETGAAPQPQPAPPARPRRPRGPAPGLGEAAEEEEQEELPPVIPPAADMRGGHFVGGLGVALVIPMGAVEDGASFGDLGVGPGFTLDLGIGISRMTVLGLAGQYALPGGGHECANCDPRTWAAGPFLRYYLVQGLRFDPWMAAGLGLRGVHFDDARSYLGVDWVKLQVGGDWYPWSSIGFGPFAEFDFGSALKAAEGGLQNRSLFVHALFGIRVVLDVPGK